MKETFYFSHDFNSHNDPKIIHLRMELGFEGYGLFWAIIEKLAQEENHFLLKNYKLLAFEFRSEEEKIKKIVEDFSLFEFDEKNFWNKRLNKHFSKREEISTKNSDNGKIGNLKRWNTDLYEKVIKKEITLEQAEKEIEKRNISPPDSDPIATLSPTCRELSQSKRKESKRKEIKEKEKEIEREEILDLFLEHYGTKVREVSHNSINFIVSSFSALSEKEKDELEIFIEEEDEKKLLIKYKERNTKGIECFCLGADNFLKRKYWKKLQEEPKKEPVHDRMAGVVLDTTPPNPNL